MSIMFTTIFVRINEKFWLVWPLTAQGAGESNFTVIPATCNQASNLKPTMVAWSETIVARFWKAKLTKRDTKFLEETVIAVCGFRLEDNILPDQGLGVADAYLVWSLDALFGLHIFALRLTRSVHMIKLVQSNFTPLCPFLTVKRLNYFQLVLTVVLV